MVNTAEYIANGISKECENNPAVIEKTIVLTGASTPEKFR